MRIARFSYEGRTSLGVVEDDLVYDIFARLPGLPPELSAWLPGGTDSWRFFSALKESAPAITLKDVELLAPIGRPAKLLALGANYRSHLDEIAHLGLKGGPHQIWFNKQVSAITDPFGPVRIPALSGQVDYEGELCVVVGRRCKEVSKSAALSYIGGYLICNDVSVRDIQFRTMTITLGKSFDTHAPIGPWLVTADAIPDPQALGLRTWVNGELRQNSNTRDMIFSVAEQIAELSSMMTLEPGDLLSTGTPAGVAVAMTEPKYLKDGDRVRIEIDGIGFIENRFVA